MGQLFTRISTGWSDQQTSTVIARNKIKRKYSDDDNSPRKRRITVNDCLAYASRHRQSFTSMILFRCQLCCECFVSKDYYLDHMIICAIEHQASIKIVRARK